MDRRRVLASLASVGLPGLTATGLPTLSLAQPAAGERVTVRGQTPIVSLQTWIDTYGRPTAAVKVNGQGPYAFVVDTGSNTSVLSSRLARALNLSLLPAREIFGVTGSTTAAFARLDRIETGRSVSTDLPVAILDAPAFERLDGIIGMDMFRDRRVRFAFARKSVDLEPASMRGTRRLPIAASVRFRHGLLIEAEGRVGAVRSKCVLDTGGDTTIINMKMLQALQTSRARRNRDLGPPTILGITNRELNGVWASIPEIELIGLRVRRLNVVAADAPVFRLWGLDQEPAMLVGMDVLSQVETLVVDYRRRQVEIQMLSNLVGGQINIQHG